MTTESGQKTELLLAGLPPVAEHIFALSKDGFELIGAYCNSCDKYFFPLREYCSNCLGKVTQTGLGSRGMVYSFTIVRTKPPFELPQPYGVAYIDLDKIPLRIFGLLDPQQLNKVCIGARVCLAVGPMGVNNADQACLRPFFRLLSAPGED